MASKTESSLLSKLESSNSTSIYSLFFDYLRPFSDVNEKDQTLIPKLASKFLSFLTKSLAIIPNRLSDSSNNDHTHHQQLTDELFDVFRLCLDCFDLVSSQLSCKNYMILVHRVGFVYCLESYGKYEDAESEGFRVLKRFRDLDFEGKSSDSEFARVFLDAVVAMVKCAALWKRKDDGVYTRVLSLIEETNHWFRVLDANAFDKLHGMLMTYLRECSLFLVGELVCFNGDLLCAFTRATLTEYAKSSMKDQMYKFSREICSSLFSLQDNKPIIIKIIFCVLDFSASQCKLLAFEDSLQCLSNQVSVMLTKVKEKDRSIESARAEATLNANAVKRLVEENERLAGECREWKREYESDHEKLLELGNEADDRNKEAQVRIHDLEAKLSEVSDVLYFYKQQYQTLGGKEYLTESQRLFEENQRLVEEGSKWKREYESDHEALLELRNEANERNKEAEVRIHDLEVQLDEVSDELNFHKQQYQSPGRLFEENQRLTEEYRRLLNVCSLYNQDCQALMEIGNEADDKAKEAETRVHDLEVQLGQVLDEVNFYKLQYHYSKLSGRKKWKLLMSC